MMHTSNNIYCSNAEDHLWMRHTISLAQCAAESQPKDVPVAAIITVPSPQPQLIEDVLCRQMRIAEATNLKESHCNPTAHAEMLVIEQASRILGRWRLTDCTIYVSLEPCIMCTGAMIQARIKRIVFSAYNPKFGALGSLMNLAEDSRMNHLLEVTPHVLEEKSRNIMQNFFQKKRRKKYESADTV